MNFYTRFGYLVVVFFLVAAVIAGGVSAAYHLHRESMSVLLLLFWGPLCVVFGRNSIIRERAARCLGFQWNIGAMGSSASEPWTLM